MSEQGQLPSHQPLQQKDDFEAPEAIGEQLLDRPCQRTFQLTVQAWIRYNQSPQEEEASVVGRPKGSTEDF